MTIPGLSQQALEIQDACNASGVIYALRRAVHLLEKEQPDSTRRETWLRLHPVVVLFADKLDDLCGCRVMHTELLDFDLDGIVDLIDRMALAMARLCDASHTLGRGTDWRNTCPVVQRLVVQLVNTACSRDTGRVLAAEQACRKMVENPNSALAASRADIFCRQNRCQDLWYTDELNCYLFPQGWCDAFTAAQGFPGGPDNPERPEIYGYAPLSTDTDSEVETLFVSISTIRGLRQIPEAEARRLHPQLGAHLDAINND
jgi:hypothetical protein